LNPGTLDASVPTTVPAALPAASPAVPAVQMRGVSKTYGEGGQAVPVLRGVTLDVARGSFVSLMGPSGSGKSTKLNLIGLLDVPTGGRIRLLGGEVTRAGSRERALLRRRSLGFVFQSFNLLARLDALHNVMLPMAIAGLPRRERRQRAKAVLASVGLGDRLTHRPSELSGGQKQRVAIARALALDPPILLADEPTGNLDSKTSAEVMQLFARLHRRGKTILQVTHNEAMARYGTRTVRILDGRILSDTAHPPARPPPPTVAPSAPVAHRGVAP
jgi:putative ABC transport system ATP-binding protein